MKIAVIDYGAGNLQSVVNALKKLGQNYEIVNSPGKIAKFDKVIFPGVGAAFSAMENLRKLDLVDEMKAYKKPFLGICIGMQLLADFSEEGAVDCLGIIPGTVKKFSTTSLKVPQIGWNQVDFARDSKLFDGIKSGEFFYFVNSYYFEVGEKFVLAKTVYGLNFPSVMQRENFYGVQFHTEKSGESGLQLLLNFCEKC